MTHQLRGQIIFRNAIGANRSMDRLFRTPSSEVPFSYYLAVGILEATEAALPAERVLGFVINKRGSSTQLQLTGAIHSLPPESAISDLGGVMTQMDVEPPYLGALMICGGMVLRKTRMPAPEGKVVHAIAALVRSPVDILPQREMLTFAGDNGRLDVIDQRKIPDSFPIGGAMAQTYGLPIWGFGEEPHSIRSTLRLDCIDACNEVHRIEMSGPMDDEKRAQIEALHASGMTDPIRWTKGEQFEEFKRRVAEQGGYRPLDTYPTAVECAKHDTMVREIVASMMREENEIIAPRC